MHGVFAYICHKNQRLILCRQIFATHGSVMGECEIRRFGREILTAEFFPAKIAYHKPPKPTFLEVFMVKFPGF